MWPIINLTPCIEITAFRLERIFLTDERLRAVTANKASKDRALPKCWVSICFYKKQPVNLDKKWVLACPIFCERTARVKLELTDWLYQLNY